MAEILYETKQKTEHVILTGICTSEQSDTEASLDELEDLAKTAGVICIGRMIQNRESVHPGTYLGKGKLEELQTLLDQTQADAVICDDELSPAQLKNMEEALKVKIIDRTLLILDIFASHASTREGKLQVELAQLKYRSSRLIGLRNFSRLGGGIGTRGPGEKKLETDRRLIRDRISHLNKELNEVKRQRQVTRKQRSKNHALIAAIVGYTNAGKSTLLNHLTQACVLEEDKLFATLDPTTRNLSLPSGQELLLTDTVGFIHKLPHHLIDAFRSTLEEAKYADLLLHVVDCSNPQMDLQMQVVYETLKQLGIQNKPIITLFNKQDKLAKPIILRDFNADKTLTISAKKEEGLDELLCTIENILKEQKIYISCTYPYTSAGKIQLIRKNGQLIKEEYVSDGIFIEAYVPQEIYHTVMP